MIPVLSDPGCLFFICVKKRDKYIVLPCSCHFIVHILVRWELIIIFLFYVLLLIDVAFCVEKASVLAVDSF